MMADMNIMRYNAHSVIPSCIVTAGVIDFSREKGLSIDVSDCITFQSPFKNSATFFPTLAEQCPLGDLNESR